MTVQYELDFHSTVYYITVDSKGSVYLSVLIVLKDFARL